MFIYKNDEWVMDLYVIIQLCTMKKHIVTFNNEVLETDQILSSEELLFHIRDNLLYILTWCEIHLYLSPPQPASPCPAIYQ